MIMIMTAEARLEVAASPSLREQVEAYWARTLPLMGPDPIGTYVSSRLARLEDQRYGSWDEETPMDR